MPRVREEQCGSDTLGQLRCIINYTSGFKKPARKRGKVVVLPSFVELWYTD